MRVFAVDPGLEHSAFVLWDGQQIQQHGIEANEDMLLRLYESIVVSDANDEDAPVLVIEAMTSYGMAVGQSTLDTIFWAGRFYQAIQPCQADVLTRRAVKLHLCGSSKAKDANIRMALIDRFGGSKEVAIGIKASKGPLYGIKSHCWAALAVAVTWFDTAGIVAELIDDPTPIVGF